MLMAPPTATAPPPAGDAQPPWDRAIELRNKMEKAVQIEVLMVLITFLRLGVARSTPRSVHPTHSYRFHANR